MMKARLALLSVEADSDPAIVFENIQPSSGVSFVLDNSATPGRVS